MLCGSKGYLPCELIAIENPRRSQHFLNRLRGPELLDQASLLRAASDHDIILMDRLAWILTDVEGVQFNVDFPTGLIAELGAFREVGNSSTLKMVSESIVHRQEQSLRGWRLEKLSRQGQCFC